MFNPETGKTADVHPDEVENMRRVGWRLTGGERPAIPVPSGLTVGKGPRGKIYIRDGKKIHSGPFDTVEDAEAALAKETGAAA